MTLSVLIGVIIKSAVMGIGGAFVISVGLVIGEVIIRFIKEKNNVK